MKTFRTIIVVLLIVFFSSCKDSGKETNTFTTKTEIKIKNPLKTISLEHLWTSDTTLITSEAVRFNKSKNVIYVSNIGEVPPNAKDGDGTLSILNTDGKVLNQNWVTGLNAPKGIAIYNAKLFVADIDEVLKIDIETGKIDKRYKIDGAKFLNDVAIDSKGAIYITDTYGNKIYKIFNDKVTVWKTFTEFNPNGIVVKNNFIVVVSYSKGDLITINKETKEQTLLAKGIEGGDGIVSIAEGYIVSNWAGEIYFASNNLNGGAATKILDTKQAKVNAADIEIIPEKNVLLIPTFFANTVDAYKIKVE